MTRAASPTSWLIARIGDAYEGGPCPCGAPLEAEGQALFSSELHRWACSSVCASKLSTTRSAPPEQTQLPVWLGGSR